MLRQSSAAACTTAAVTVMLTLGAVQAADRAEYPNRKGQWSRLVVPAVEGGLPNPGFDPRRPRGRGQQAPLTAEYVKVLGDSIADQEKGGLGNYPSSRCIPSGMPRMTTFYEFEYVITPDTTYILIGGDDHYRRIFTDGRSWTQEIQPTYSGYSIGRWIDEDGDGHYDMLEVETRGLKGPRAYEASGLPLHFDNQSIFRERFYLDKANANILRDEITTIDHALTWPWTVDKPFVRNQDPHPEYYRSLGLVNIVIGNEKLCPERRWFADASPEKPGATRLAVFQTGTEVMSPTLAK